MAAPPKVFITPSGLRFKSIQLAMQVVKDDFRPTYMVALWRGGAPIGCVMHEVFKYKGLAVDHIAIRTSRYTGIGQVASKIQVHNLGYLEERLTVNDRLLLVDDIWDSGHSIEAVLENLKLCLGDRMPSNVRVATVYYKPKRNKTMSAPDYHVTETDEWVVFPHELEALTDEEVEVHMGKEALDLLKGA